MITKQIMKPESFSEAYVEANEGRIVSFCEARDPTSNYLLMPGIDLTEYAVSMNLYRLSKVPRFLLGRLFDKKMAKILYVSNSSEPVQLIYYDPSCPLEKKELIAAARRGRDELANRLEKEARKERFL